MSLPSLLLFSALLASPACWAEKPGKILVSEQIRSRLVANRLSEFKVSPDGLSVAYTVGSGRYGDQFGGGEGPDWEYSTLIVDGRPEGRDNRWYENTHWTVYSPDRKQVARVNKSYRASGPSYISLNGQAQKSYGQVYSPQFSPDSKHFAYIAHTYDPYGDLVVLDGIEGKRYESLVKDANLKFSPDSQRLAYIASNRVGRDREIFMVIDGKEGMRYSGIDIASTFSPDSKHFAYTARTLDMKWTAVIDETEGRHFEAKYISDPIFSPDSKRLAYRVTIDYDGGGAFVVVDDLIGRRFSTIWPDKVRFSFDSQHFAYAAQEGKKWFIVVDHKEVSRYDFVSQITYSPVDLHLAYVASVGKKAFVVRDGVPGKKYDQIANLVFSPDGKALAYAAYMKKLRQWVVVVDGRETPAYDFVLAWNAYEEGATHSVNESSFRFESAETLRFLAVRKKNIVMVRAHFGRETSPSTR